MKGSQLSVLTEWLQHLERQNHRLKRSGGVVLLAVAAVVLMGQARPMGHTVEAERFIVSDAHGRPRASLALGFFDKDGKPIRPGKLFLP